MYIQSVTKNIQTWATTTIQNPIWAFQEKVDAYAKGAKSLP
jgi:hypothetical protein